MCVCVVGGELWICFASFVAQNGSVPIRLRGRIEMGYLKPEYVIALVGGDDVREIDAFVRKTRGARKWIKKFGKLSNSFVVYFMTWDGSKEGWDVSNKADEVRELFIDHLRKSVKYLSLLHVQHGGDAGETKILYSTDHDR